MSILIRTLIQSNSALSAAVGAYWLARAQPSEKAHADGSVVRLAGNTLTVSNGPGDADFRFMLYALCQMQGWTINGSAKPKPSLPQSVLETIGQTMDG